MLFQVQVDVPYSPKHTHSNAHSAPRRFRQAEQSPTAPQPRVRTLADRKTLNYWLVAFHPAGSNHYTCYYGLFFSFSFTPKRAEHYLSWSANKS